MPLTVTVILSPLCNSDGGFGDSILLKKVVHVGIFAKSKNWSLSIKQQSFLCSDHCTYGCSDLFWRCCNLD